MANTTWVPDRAIRARNQMKATDKVRDVVIGPNTDLTSTNVVGG